MRLVHISVDLTEAWRSLIHTKVQLPVKSGAVAIFTTPLWIQESHRDNGPVAGVAGLYFTSASEDKTLRWCRNPTRPSEYYVEIPTDTDVIHAVFDAVITRKATRRMVMLCWEHVLLYPARRDVDKIRIQASVIVPRGWRTGTALENLGQPIITDTADEGGQTLLYQPTSLARLADSPVLTGLHFDQYAVTTDQRHVLCVAADREEYAAVPQDTLDRLASLVGQTSAAFGARHYDTIWFLVALTDYWPGPGGSEHHDSCDIVLPLKTLSDTKHLEKNGTAIAHEFVHSWNGKFRRPAGHMPRDFATPLDARLLWVYEGLTQYYGGVLSVRGGLASSVFYRAELARTVARLEGQTGRLWRSSEDTCTGTSLRGGSAWENWKRDGQDYYDDGVLLWLDVDTLIRSKTNSKRSLDDFTRAFFGQGTPTSPTVIPYTLDDIVASLDTVAGNNWQAFFDMKVIMVSPRVNIEGIERAGYQFTFVAEPGIDQEQNSDEGTSDAVWNSIGVRLGEDGRLVDVRRGSAADTAKLAPRQTVVKVGEVQFSLKTLAAEITANKDAPGSRIRFTMTQEGDEWLAELDYHAGLRYPRLERQAYVPDMLSAILHVGDVDL
ncbi:peptidase m61 domain containing protein [Grosmannia clavigera kw1407]|uniref:Peptidase m61 domain containing protein n=1 Tax=Grosmannia clavigera (strain kw1407 / UAMH 11150) TaxID=655863 RepID=F0XJI0_GROCL|nr:peptidase m61 domain containing protein [Grosmannia clavigera kw1407]EFX02110.1 peptidase m61 domain containing protein [Grosmannia clavigera kw1407]